MLVLGVVKFVLQVDCHLASWTANVAQPIDARGGGGQPGRACIHACLNFNMECHVN